MDWTGYSPFGNSSNFNDPYDPGYWASDQSGSGGATGDFFDDFFNDF
jgi:hypothetical protein